MSGKDKVNEYLPHGFMTRTHTEILATQVESPKCSPWCDNDTVAYVWDEKANATLRTEEVALNIVPKTGLKKRVPVSKRE